MAYHCKGQMATWKMHIASRFVGWFHLFHPLPEQLVHGCVAGQRVRCRAGMRTPLHSSSFLAFQWSGFNGGFKTREQSLKSLVKYIKYIISSHIIRILVTMRVYFCMCDCHIVPPYAYLILITMFHPMFSNMQIHPQHDWQYYLFVSTTKQAWILEKSFQGYFLDLVMWMISGSHPIWSHTRSKTNMTTEHPPFEDVNISH